MMVDLTVAMLAESLAVKMVAQKVVQLADQ